MEVYDIDKQMDALFGARGTAERSAFEAEAEEACRFYDQNGCWPDEAGEKAEEYEEEYAAAF